MVRTYVSDHNAVCVNFQHLYEFSKYSNSNIQKKILDYVLAWAKKKSETEKPNQTPGGETV